MLKTYQFKTHCKGDSHSSKTANIILPGLVTEYRWTPLRVVYKRSSIQTRWQELFQPASMDHAFELQYDFEHVRTQFVIILIKFYVCTYVCRAAGLGVESTGSSGYRGRARSTRSNGRRWVSVRCTSESNDRRWRMWPGGGGGGAQIPELVSSPPLSLLSDGTV